MLQYLTLLNYRESVFYELANDSRIAFSICCGQHSPYPKIRNFEPRSPLRVHFVRNLIWEVSSRHAFVWQLGAIWNMIRLRPEVLIMLGVDPHILSSFPQFLIAKMLGIKVFWWSHATLGKQGLLGRSMRLFFYRRATGILTYDDEGEKRMLEVGIPPDRVQTIWNCINYADYEMVAGLPIRERKADSPIRVLFIGRMYADKKMHLLVDAIKKLRDRRIAVVVDAIGDGPDLEKTQRMVSALGLDDAFTFHGPKFGDELVEFLEVADVGIVPSWAGLSVIQYMAAGVPVVTEENRGDNHPPEVSAIVEGKTGSFFKFEDSRSLADTIVDVSSRQQEFSRSCRKMVEERFTPAAVKDAIIKGIFEATEN